MLLPLDGPAAYGSKSITDTASEIKVNASVLEERKVVTLQPIDGHIWYGYDNTVTTSTGTKIFKGQWIQLEIGDQLPIWAIADTGQTVDIRISEVS